MFNESCVMGVHIHLVEAYIITDCSPSRDMLFDSTLFFEPSLYICPPLILILLADEHLPADDDYYPSDQRCSRTPTLSPCLNVKSR